MDWLKLYRTLCVAREIDAQEQAITRRGEAFFHVAGRGHESSATLASLLAPSDWLHAHYRDKALLLARGMTPRDIFDSLFCNGTSSSAGRQMSAHLCAPELNVLSMVGPVGNNALQSIGVAAEIKSQNTNPLVVCSVGDGTTQQGEFLEACAEAARHNLPVLFLIEDNRFAISTRTEGQTFYALDKSTGLKNFCGIPITEIDGRDPVMTYSAFEPIVGCIRKDRGPQMAVLHVERLTNHTNADDQSIYRDADDIAAAQRTADPVLRLHDWLLAQGEKEATLKIINDESIAYVAAAAKDAFAAVEPAATHTAVEPMPVELTHPGHEVRLLPSNDGEDAVGLAMRDALREVLRHHLATDARVSLYGQDIEDPKGDVFGVTKGLSTQFGDRVKNAPLTESTIVGTAVGRALAGGKPIAFLQFADFFPLAANQIMAEMSSIFWRTNGKYRCPVIVMAACGGYRPGLGPFHSQTNESLAAATPGIDVYMPSHAADAAGLLNNALASNRPAIFLYPKACLNDSKIASSKNVTEIRVPIGRAHHVRSGRDLTLVGWGNTVRICEQAADLLATADVETDILDLRTIKPWDEQAVLASVARTANLVVVHEDNGFCGVGSEILATVAEKSRLPVAMRRVTRAETYVPCHYPSQLEVLPSPQRVVDVAADLLDLDVTWTVPEVETSDIAAVEAIGSGPADETVTVVEVCVKVGDTIAVGDTVASLEASKSVFDLASPIAGEVTEISCQEGDVVAVGGAIVMLKLSEKLADRKKKHVEPKPTFARRHTKERVKVPRGLADHRKFDVGIASVAAVSGSRNVTNEELLSGRTDRFDIFKRTGISQRRWITPEESAVSMAVEASRKVLAENRLLPDDLDLLICSTTSPTIVTPSMSCQILNELIGDKQHAGGVQAYDISAACSGYLYALQNAYDFLQSQPEGRVLVVTAEAISPMLDVNDLETLILFGDASTATLLLGEAHMKDAKLKVLRPELSAKGDNGEALTVPLLHDGFIRMRGRTVFHEAVRTMISSLNRVCRHEKLDVADLDLVVPHQANGRILDAVNNRIPAPVHRNIADYGNTSSSSIPLCLDDLLPKLSRGDKLGLCAFGGGFTFGAGVVEAT